MGSLRDCFVDSMARQGDRKAITFLREGNVESEISYKGLDLDSNRMANTCLDLGVAKGDRVILFFPKSVIFVVAHLALQKIGAIAVPLNPGFKPSEMEYFINDAKAELVLSGPEQQAMIKEIDANLSNLVNFGLLTGFTIIMALLADFFLAPALMAVLHKAHLISDDSDY